MKALFKWELPYQKSLMVYMVEEEVKATEMTAMEAVLFADTEWHALIERLKDEEKKENSDVKIIEKLNKWLEEIDSDTAESRCAEILSGLGFTTEM